MFKNILTFLFGWLFVSEDVYIVPRCARDGCNGVINEKIGIPVMIKCREEISHPCSICGGLGDIGCDGAVYEVNEIGGGKLYFKDNHLLSIDAKGIETIIA